MLCNQMNNTINNGKYACIIRFSLSLYACIAMVHDNAIINIH